MGKVIQQGIMGYGTNYMPLCTEMFDSDCDIIRLFLQCISETDRCNM